MNGLQLNEWSFPLGPGNKEIDFCIRFSRNDMHGVDGGIGLTEDMYGTNSCHKESSNATEVRWMVPESIENNYVCIH